MESVHIRNRKITSFTRTLFLQNYIILLILILWLPVKILGGQLDSIEDDNDNSSSRIVPTLPSALPSYHSPQLLTIKERDICSKRRATHIWDETLLQCFPRASLNDSITSLIQFRCASDLQCIHSTMGVLSRCSPKKKLCECYDGDSEGRIPTIFYNVTGKCYVQKHFENFCSEDVECKAGIHPNAICADKQPAFLPLEKICICSPGKSCKKLEDNCKTTRECQEGINRYAECRVHIGENVCMCQEGRICEYGFSEELGGWSAVEIAGISVGATVATLTIIVVAIVFFLRRRKHKYFV